MALLLTNAHLLDPEGAADPASSLLIEGGRIHEVLAPGAPPPRGAQAVDLGARRLAPGFIDLHLHGQLAFAAPEQMDAALRQTAASLLRHGTTAFLATTVSWKSPGLEQRVEALARAVGAFSEASHDARQTSGFDAGPDAAATPIGIHLEGPWLNPAAAGAQPPDALLPYDAASGTALLDQAGKHLRMVTLAPEVGGAQELVAELRRRCVVAAIGHSRATPEQFDAAVAGGMTHVTHLFNAMSGLHHREPGVVGCALAERRLTCDLVCDGVHVDPRVVRLAAACLGERLVLISDRIDLPEVLRAEFPAELPADLPAERTADLPKKARGRSPETSFGSGPVHDDGAALRLADGRLAGSSLQLDRALRNAVSFGALGEAAAIAAVTLRPARVLGIEAERGTLRPGARADFAVLGAEGQVVETWLGGKRIAVR